MSTSEKHTKRKSSRPAPRREEAENQFGATLKSALFGTGIALLAAMLLLFLCAGICYGTADPDALTTPLSLSALYLSAMIGGFASVRRNRGGALFCGALCGALLILAFLMINLCFHATYSRSFSPMIALLLRAVVLLFSVLGGFLGLHRRTAAGSRHRRK